MGTVTNEMEKRKANIFCGCTEIHQHQAIMERFLRTLAECLSGYQYTVIGCPRGKGLPNGSLGFVLWSALNCEVTHLTRKKPAEPIKEKTIIAKPVTP